MARIIQFIRLALPWMLRIAWGAFQLMLLSIVSLWRGILPSARMMVDNWTDTAHRSGVPTTYDTWLYNLGMAVAYIMIAIGWLITAFVTVWLVGMIV